MFEDTDGVHFSQQIWSVPRNSDLTVHATVNAGLRITRISYPYGDILRTEETSSGESIYTLSLRSVRYPAVVSLTVLPNIVTSYHSGKPGETAVTVDETSERLRINTLPWDRDISMSGYLPIGWNTEPDGSGSHIGFGSRLVRTEQQTDLYAEWLPASPESAFVYTESEGGAVITGYTGYGALVIPELLGGLPVTGIARGAFGDLSVQTVVFPPSLRFLENGAFRSLQAEDLYLFDGLESISDSSFGTYQIHRLHINAMRVPVYCGSYFDTLSEKIDYLDSLRNEKKLILFCGSSARFGYDSAMLEAAFPEYRVVNMGVYAYETMLPQARLIRQYLSPGDIVLSSPELDAIPMQFCGENRIQYETFAMMESNFDMFSLLDCRDYQNVFDAFGEFQLLRSDMVSRSYTDTPSHFDEDGKPQSTPVYNRAGDYILYRPDNTSGRLFGVRRASYCTAGIREQDWEGLNQVYDEFAAEGAQILFLYSPRSRRSITQDSTPEAMEQLDRAIRNRLHAQVLSSPQDSLMDALYFYGTDNHLSTQGVQLHTQAVIDALRLYFAGSLPE